MNYQVVLDETLKKLNNVPKLLLHGCCAPCSSYVLEYLSNYFYITLFYYNPNIDTVNEYNKRMEEVNKLIKLLKPKYPISFVDLGYNSNEYLNEVVGLEREKEGGRRCLKCYNLRLNKAFIYAESHNFDYITTTLTISPHKNSQVINNIGFNLEKKYHVKYLYSDFKKKEGYKRSIILSKKYDLYRQDYCGCVYSKPGI